MPKKRLKFVIGVGIILVVFSWQAIVGFQENQTYYITVQELVKGPEYEKRLRVGGIVMPGSILRESGSLTFRLSQEEDSIPVVYVGMETPPDTFVDRVLLRTGGDEAVTRALKLLEQQSQEMATAYSRKLEVKIGEALEAVSHILRYKLSSP